LDVALLVQIFEGRGFDVQQAALLHLRDESFGAVGTEQARDPVVSVQGVAEALRYPTDSAIMAGGAASVDAEVGEAEEESAIDERRFELLLLLKNAAKLIPGDAVSAVHSAVQRVLPDASGADKQVLWQDVECAVVLLYEIGEPLLDEVNKAGCGIFEETVLLLMASPLTHAHHRLVASALLECLVRCALLLRFVAVCGGLLSQPAFAARYVVQLVDELSAIALD
jgi:hypothetical protein